MKDKTNRYYSLFNKSKYSNAIVYLGESKIPFPAHRLVLGISSSFFDDALTSDFKEVKTQEFTFQEDSPHALWRVLQYMYTGDYTDETSEHLGSEGIFIFLNEVMTKKLQAMIVKQRRSIGLGILRGKLHCLC